MLWELSRRLRRTTPRSSSTGPRHGPREVGRTTRLTLLLPHGFEGTGRGLERPGSSASSSAPRRRTSAWSTRRPRDSTSTLVRRQALNPDARPLIVIGRRTAPAREGGPRPRWTISPTAGFEPVLDDPAVADRAAVTEARPDRREVLLRHRRARAQSAGEERRRRAHRAAVSVPSRAGHRLLTSYPSLEEVVWAQRTPETSAPGRRSATGSRKRSTATRCGYVGRPSRASPNEGYPTSHLRAPDRIVRQVLETRH